MEMIKHQFLLKEFFLPNWEIDTLVLGTFNPICGEKTDYFYGRKSNNFWKAVEKLCQIEEKCLLDNFPKKLGLMRFYKFGCTDIIKGVKTKKNVDNSKICGKGYSDSFLFTQKYCELTFQFDEIKKFILDKKVQVVINTWGKRKNPKYFKISIADLKEFCQKNKVVFISECPSPSGRFKTANNFRSLCWFYGKYLIKHKPT